MKNRRMLLAALSVVGAMMMCGAALAQDPNTTTSNTTQQTTTNQNNNTTTTTTTQTMTTYVAPDLANRLSVSDTLFLMDLIHANALEIEMSQLAAKRAGSYGVSAFASQMVTDHTNAMNQLISQYGNQPFLTDWQHSLRRSAGPSSGYSYYYSNNYMSTYQNPASSNAMNGQSGTMSNSGSTYQGTNNSTAQAPTLNGDLGNGFNNWMYLSASDWDKIHELDSLTGYAFDKAYVAEQVRQHAMLLDKIGMQMDRGSTNTGVQTWVTNGQGMVQHHLEEARRISYNYDDPFNIDRPWPWIH